MKRYVLTLILLLGFHLTNSATICMVTDLLIDIKTCYDEVEPYDYSIYYNKMGILESSNDYQVVNRFGYMGKYQFGRTTLKFLVKKGFLDATNNEIKRKNFLKDRDLQERAMLALTDSNFQVLKNYNLLKYEGHVINGVKITIEGMLAASHLRGPNSVKRFLRSNGKTNLTDGNNTSVSDYIKQFEN